MATITKSIGTSSRDYSTMTAWEADLDVATIYQSGDDAVGECYNDSTFDESVTISGGATVGLNSIELTVADGERHDGTAGSGVRVVATSSRNFTLNVACTVKWIELDGQDSYYCYVYGNSGSSRSYINQMIIHNIVTATSTITIVVAGYADRLTALNTIVYKADCLSGVSGASCRGFYANNHSDMKAYNCTAYSINASFDPTDVNCQSYGSQSSDLTAINCIGMDSQDSDFGNVIETYSISSDSTAVGTGCLANKTAANQFVSIVAGSEDLHLKSGSDAIGAGTDLGTTPDGVQYDIDGFDRDAANRVWDIGADQAAATITKTIGTTARDYSTMTLWEADLDDSTVYQSGDDAVGECYNDSTFDESVSIDSGGTVGLSSLVLTVADGEKHDGTVGTGARIVRTVGGTTIITASIDGMELSWLEIDCNENATGVTAISSQEQGQTHSNLICHGGRRDTGGGLLAWTRPAVGGTTNNCSLLNSIFYNFGWITSGSGGSFSAISSISSVREIDIANCTLFKIFADDTSGGVKGVDIREDADSSIKNTIAVSVTNTGSGSAACFDTYSVTDTSNNLSSDATAPGTNSLLNKSSDQFVSIVSGSEDLHLKSGSDAIGAGTDLGTTPDGVQYDIDGFDRDAANRVWDIGADQAAATVTKTIGTTARDYSTMTLWEADLDDATVYQSGDDAVGECYNDSTFTAQADIVITRTDLSSMTLKAADGEGHDGTSGTGVVINTTAPNHIRYRDAHVPLIVERIELAGSTIAIRTNRLATYKRMLIHNSSSTFATEGGQEPATLMNSIIYTAISGPNCLGHKNYNNTIYNMTNDGVSRAIAVNAGEVKNTISVGNGGEDFDTGTAQSESYCMSSDTTASGTGSITSVVTADQFVSIVSGSEDLHLKSGSDAIGAGADLGTTPDGVQYDIDGFDRDAANRVWDIGADQAAATVTKTIGTTARDYSTITLWEADLDDTTVYQSGDDAVGECYNDSTFDEYNIVLNGGQTVGLDSVELTVAETERHDGTAGTGAKIDVSEGGLASSNKTIIRGAGLDNRYLKWLEITRSNITNTTALNGVAYVRYIHALIVHDIYNTSASYQSGVTGIASTWSSNYQIIASNCIVYNIEGARSTSGFYLQKDEDQVLNNTVYNIKRTAANASYDCYGIRRALRSPTIKNCISVGTNAEFGSFGDFTGGGTQEYNLSSDSTASGTGSITSAVTADQFVSIVSGSEDLHLKAGSDAIGAGVDLGTTPAGVEIDIDGRDRDAEGDTWSIGADQFVEILYRHFFTRLGLRATPQAYWFWEGSRTVSEEEEGSKGKNFFIFFY